MFHNVLDVYKSCFSVYTNPERFLGYAFAHTVCGVSLAISFCHLSAMFDDVMLRRVVVRPLFVLIFAIHGLRTLFDVELFSFLNCNSVSKGFGTPGKYFWPPLYICILQ